MKKSIITILLPLLVTGCSVESHNPKKPAVMADKGSYFAQDKSESIASNLIAFAGYPHKISDNPMPTSLKGALDFTSGAYMGFSGFSSLWGAGGIGSLSLLTGDDIIPFTYDSVIVIAKIQPGEKYNDLSVAQRTFENYFTKIDGSFLAKDKSSAAYQHEVKRKKFSQDKSMTPASCEKSGVISSSLLKQDAECWVNDPDYKVHVIFSRPATGQEFPELALLPKSEYSVMLFNLWANYKVRDDAAWAAKLDTKHNVFSFKKMRAPFISPDKNDNGKRILFSQDSDQQKVIYK